MAEVTFRSDFTVELIDYMGSDVDIVHAARVHRPDREPDVYGLSDRDEGLLNMLMRDRHGTPWEHVVLQFYIEAPIFVARESHRHRIASVNEESGRYKELGPVFYLPPPSRPLVQEGRPGAYTFTEGTRHQKEQTHNVLGMSSEDAHQEYRHLLSEGVAREVARMVLPVNIYTSWWLTINLRSLFNFLSLRSKTDETTVPTFPMWEIEQVAKQMEAKASAVLPNAFEVFNKNGRVAP